MTALTYFRFEGGSATISRIPGSSYRREAISDTGTHTTLFGNIECFLDIQCFAPTRFTVSSSCGVTLQCYSCMFERVQV